MPDFFDKHLQVKCLFGSKKRVGHQKMVDFFDKHPQAKLVFFGGQKASVTSKNDWTLPLFCQKSVLGIWKKQVTFLTISWLFWLPSGSKKRPFQCGIKDFSHRFDDCHYFLCDQESQFNHEKGISLRPVKGALVSLLSLQLRRVLEPHRGNQHLFMTLLLGVH